jgi:hypothetical protein
LQICRSTANWLRLGLMFVFIPVEWQGNTSFQAIFFTRYGMALKIFPMVKRTLTCVSQNAFLGADPGEDQQVTPK